MIRFGALILGCLVWTLTHATAAEKLLPAPELTDSGLYHQDWFHEGFLELPDDLEEAAADGKDLIILVEQAGCPYCRELHQVNLRIPPIVEKLQADYLTMQIDLRGSREVVDMDGETLEERDLVRKWGIIFTPTVVIIPAEATDGEGNGAERSVFKMPGYFKPFHFDTMLHYVSSDAYQSQDFQRYLDGRAQEQRAGGKKVKIW